MIETSTRLLTRRAYLTMENEVERCGRTHLAREMLIAGIDLELQARGISDPAELSDRILATWKGAIDHDFLEGTDTSSEPPVGLLASTRSGASA